jgi:mono/diheme cytochrome c family protein
MKLTATFLVCFALTLICFGCAFTSAPTNSPGPVSATSTPGKSDEFAAARSNYQKNCKDCHGPAAEGGIVKLEGKDVKIPSLKSEHAIKRTDARITETITLGDEEMPPFKAKLTPTEIADLVKLIRKDFQKQ